MFSKEDVEYRDPTPRVEVDLELSTLHSQRRHREEDVRERTGGAQRWWARGDSNPRPPGYEPGALPG